MSHWQATPPGMQKLRHHPSSKFHVHLTRIVQTNKYRFNRTNAPFPLLNLTAPEPPHIPTAPHGLLGLQSRAESAAQVPLPAARRRSSTVFSPAAGPAATARLSFLASSPPRIVHQRRRHASPFPSEQASILSSV